MQRVFTANGQLSVPVEPSVGALLEEVAGLVDEVARLGKGQFLLQIWFGQSQEERDQAYWAAQQIYGMPEVAALEQESPQGLVYFWTRIKTLLEETLSGSRPDLTGTALYDPLEKLPLHRGDLGGSLDGQYFPGKHCPPHRV
ncbi:MAG: hypothetical protein KBD65_00190 [Candidatus Moranbacteria bacterium]|nr:hypothetical protein [Candidatus Moranbacteria bacterium]